MKAYTVNNPTTVNRGVRVDGVVTVIDAGKTKTIEAGWSQDQIAKYVACGLVISEVKPKPVKE